MGVQQNWLANLRALVDREGGDNPRAGFQAVSAATGLSEEYIYQLYEGKPKSDGTERNVGARAARAIARAYAEGRPPDWFDLPPLAGESPHEGGVVGVMSSIPSPHRLVGNIAVALMNVEASMGRGALVPDHEEVVRHMDISEAWLRRHATFSRPEDLALITGFGDSMQPTYSDGDVLLVDRGIKEVKVDAVYVLALADELYIKRLQRRPDGSMLMISDNKAYEPYAVTNGARDKFQVLGRVVMAWNARRM